MAKSKPFLERFWSFVEKGDGCWLWIGTRDQKGYGSITRDGKSQRAHREMWRIMHGEIPDKLCVLHRCDNPPCVNPDHLFLGTISENNIDCREKGRDNHNRGSKVPSAKLTEADVLKIKEILLHKKGREKPRLTDIAAMFGVTKKAILVISNGTGWRHVQLPGHAPGCIVAEMEKVKEQK